MLRGVLEGSSGLQGPGTERLADSEPTYLGTAMKWLTRCLLCRTAPALPVFCVLRIRIHMSSEYRSSVCSSVLSVGTAGRTGCGYGVVKGSSCRREVIWAAEYDAYLSLPSLEGGVSRIPHRTVWSPGQGYQTEVCSVVLLWAELGAACSLCLGQVQGLPCPCVFTPSMNVPMDTHVSPDDHH